MAGPAATISGMLFGDYAESADHGSWGASIVEGLATRLAAGRVRAGETARGGVVVNVSACGGPVPIACQELPSLPAAVSAAQKARAMVVVLGLAFNKHCDQRVAGLSLAMTTVNGKATTALGWSCHWGAPPMRPDISAVPTTFPFYEAVSVNGRLLAYPCRNTRDMLSH